MLEETVAPRMAQEWKKMKRHLEKSIKLQESSQMSSDFKRTYVRAGSKSTKAKTNREKGGAYICWMSVTRS